MCIGFLTVQYRCGCVFNTLTRVCTAHPEHSAVVTFAIQNRANIPCALVRDGEYCPALDREAAAGQLALELFCPLCVEAKYAEVRRFFCEEHSPTAEHIATFRKHARRLLRFALDAVMLNPVTGQPIADTAFISRKLWTLERKLLKWKGNMRAPSQAYMDKIARWAWDQYVEEQEREQGH